MVVLDVNQDLTPDPVIFLLTIQKIFPPLLPVIWFLFPLKKVLKNLSMARDIVKLLDPIHQSQNDLCFSWLLAVIEDVCPLFI